MRTLYLVLRDGRRVRFGQVEDLQSAIRMRTGIEAWLHEGMTLSVANARGELEEVNPSSVTVIGLSSDDATPSRGSPINPSAGAARR